MLIICAKNIGSLVYKYFEIYNILTDMLLPQPNNRSEPRRGSVVVIKHTHKK